MTDADTETRSSKKPNRRRRFWRVLLPCLILPMLWPESGRIPVANANSGDYHPQSFWYHPWGRSGVHKGIDIFAPKGRSVLSPVEGLVVYRGNLKMGGKVVLVLGPKWRLHYFAHLDKIDPGAGWFAWRGKALGTVGDTGNAQGKPPHLHYSKLSLVPLPWHWRPGPQSWKRLFFVNPIDGFDAKEKPNMRT